MQELEIVDSLYRKLQVSQSPYKILEEVLAEEFFPLSSSQKSVYLTNLLNGLMRFDISADTIVALYKVLMTLDNYNRESKPIANFKNSKVLECTGSGKKPFKTLNISTPSILTAVAAGAKIIKKGSSATSSIIGSADLIYGLGLNPKMTFEQQEKLLYDTGFTFINIETVIPIFNSIYNGHFYKPHILSLVLAADVTSLRGDKIVYGLSSQYIEKSCLALSKLNNTTDVTVYTSSENQTDYFDEILGKGTCNIVRYKKENSTVQLYKMVANTISPDKIKALSSPKESINSVLKLLKNNSNESYVDVVSKNAGFYLLESSIVDSLKEGIMLANEMLTTRKVYDKLIEIIECSGGTPTWCENGYNEYI